MTPPMTILRIRAFRKGLLKRQTLRSTPDKSLRLVALAFLGALGAWAQQRTSAGSCCGHVETHLKRNNEISMILWEFMGFYGIL